MVDKYLSSYKERVRAQQRAYRKVFRKTPHGKMSKYKESAKKRNLVFDLTLEQVKSLLDGICHYCGELNSIGIDRKDSTCGYTTDNTVSCCSTCNFMKSDHPYDDFIKHIIKIFNYYNKPRMGRG